MRVLRLCGSQLGWKPAPNDDPLIATDRLFIKHGYTPPLELVDYAKSIGAVACCLAEFKQILAALRRALCCSTLVCVLRCLNGSQSAPRLIARHNSAQAFGATTLVKKGLSRPRTSYRVKLGRELINRIHKAA